MSVLRVIFAVAVAWAAASVVLAVAWAVARRLGWTGPAVPYRQPVVHMLPPPDGPYLCPCCEVDPFGLPSDDELTASADEVTCGREAGA